MAEPDGGLSPQARAWLAATDPDDDEPIDFDRIAEIRTETHGRWHETSDRALERWDVTTETIAVGGVECLRVTSPTAGTDNGTLLWIFGGAFLMGTPYTELPITAALANLAGLEVIAPSYRLAPEHTAPAAASDCLAVYRELAARPGPLALGGESAGGNLALVTAQQARLQGLRLPDALALLSPAVDLRTDPDLMAAAPHDPTLSKTRMSDVVRAYPGERALDDPTVSPIFGSMDGLPPTIITTGTRDMLLPGCLRLARKMRRAGVHVDCRVWDGLWHVFEFYDAYPEQDESLRDVAGFLTQHRSP